MANIYNDISDLRYLTWNRIRNSSGTTGSFLKSSEKKGKTRLYYKLSDYDSVNGITGHECINEIIADRLLTALDIPHLEYDLVHALIDIGDREYDTYLCRSRDYRMPSEDKVALDVYYELEKKPEETPYDFCNRMGWEEYISQMLILDHLILNRDRHGANIEVLKDRSAKSIRPVPLYDHGLSLAFSAHSDEEISSFNIKEERPIQCFVGSRYAYDNLKMIPAKYVLKLPKFDKTLKSFLFNDLTGIVSEKWIDTIWKMIKYRVKLYEDFFNTK